MAKRTLIRPLLLLLVAALCLSLAACGAPAAPEPEPTPAPEPLPESEIMFLSIPWGTPEEEALAIIKEKFPDINTIEQNVSHTASSFSDPQGKYMPSISTEAVSSKHLKLEYTSSYYTLPIGTVAGHRVNTIYLDFVQINGEYVLHKAEYYFGDDLDFAPLEVFSDLQEKMSKLYGTPETYSFDEDDYYKSTSLCAVWNSDDGSAVYLQYSLYLSGYLNGHESVALHYGTTSVNEILENAERDKAEKEAAEKQQHLDEVEQDDSGL